MCRPPPSRSALDVRALAEMRRMSQRAAEQMTSDLFEEWTSPDQSLTGHGTLDETDLIQFHPFRARRTSSTAMAATGLFSRLPIEVVHVILNQVDLHSLLKLSSSHPLFAAFVTLPTYALIQRHFPIVLRSIEAIGAGHNITCSRLYRTITFPYCQDCYAYGPYIYLLTARRLCFACLVAGEEHVPMTDAVASKTFGLPQRVFANLPHITTLQAQYGRRKAIMQPQRLMDYTMAFEAARAYVGSLHGLQRLMSEERRKRSSRDDFPVRHIYHNVCPGSLYGGFAGVSPADAYRHMALVKAGWLDEETGKVEHGRVCRGCMRYEGTCQVRYVEETFRQHVAIHGPVERGGHITELLA